MRSRPKKHIGLLVTVQHCPNAYQLPDGLPEGATVKLGRFDRGTYDVEFEGRTFRIDMTCVATQLPWEYEISPGRWLEEGHPLVQAVKRGEESGWA